jgi:hypothetical protein
VATGAVPGFELEQDATVSATAAMAVNDRTFIELPPCYRPRTAAIAAA